MGEVQKISRSKGVGVSQLLEEIIKEEMLEDELANALINLGIGDLEELATPHHYS